MTQNQMTRFAGGPSMTQDEIAKLVAPMTAKARSSARFLTWASLITGFAGGGFAVALMHSDPRMDRSTVIGMFVLIVIFVGILPALVGRRFILTDVKEVPHLLRIGSPYPGKLVRYARIPGGPMRHAVVEWDEDGISCGAHLDIVQPDATTTVGDVTVIANLGNPNVAVVLNGDLHVGVRNSGSYRRWKTAQGAK